MTSFIETAIEDIEKNTEIYHRYYKKYLKGELENSINWNLNGRLNIYESFFDYANQIGLLYARN